MTVRRLDETTQKFIGQSTDVKPALTARDIGSLFIEEDTDDVYELLVGGWTLKESPSINSLLDLRPAALWDFRQLSVLDDGDPVSVVLDSSGNDYHATAVGITQIETATVVETVPGALLAGDAEVIVTADGMTGSPKTYAVALALNDDEGQVATKIRAALSADSAITNIFEVSGTGSDVVLTKLLAATNDATLNISIADDTCV